MPRQILNKETFVIVDSQDRTKEFGRHQTLASAELAARNLANGRRIDLDILRETVVQEIVKELRVDVTVNETDI